MSALGLLSRGSRQDDFRTEEIRFKYDESVPFIPRLCVVEWPRAIGSPRAWHAASIVLVTYLGRSAAAFVTEFRARRAIKHLRSLDDDRLWDLGLKRKDIERFVHFGRD